MVTVLDRQLEALQRSSAEPAADRREQVQELVDVALALHAAVDEKMARWHAADESSRAALGSAWPDHVMALYDQLAKAYDRIAAHLEDAGRASVGVGSADELLTRRGHLRAMLSAAPEKVLRAEADAAAGRVRSMREVRDAVRGRLHG